MLVTTLYTLYTPSSFKKMGHERNPGIPYYGEWVANSRVNLAATKRRADSHNARRSVKMEWQSAWLLRVIQVIDLTTLAGDDTGM